MKQALRDGDSCDKVAQFSLELQLPLTKLYSHAAQGLRPWQEQISVKILQALLLKPCHKMTHMIIMVMKDRIILVIWMTNPQNPHLHPQDLPLGVPHQLHNI